jgi:signal transduction histidine kinase
LTVPEARAITRMHPMSPASPPNSSFRLGELLDASAPQIIEDWRVRVEAMARHHGLTTVELLDHMPQFLAEVTRAALALPADAPDAGASQHAGMGWPSPDHGRQRLRDGFDVDEVVREYGILGDVVLARCAEVGLTPSIAESRLLTASLLAGASEAIAGYIRRRDRELQQLASRHLAFIAHELRTPLGSAGIAADLLADRATEDMKTAIGILRRSLARLQTQIDSVLVVDGPRPIVERASLSVVTVLREVREDVLPEARLKTIEIVCAAAERIDVVGDARMLASAFGNVVRNAVKYSGPGTEVRIEAQVLGDDVRVDVADRCGGLPPGYESMFKPWVRMNEHEEGHGLGLAIAKQAIEAHGGWIDVRNRPGVGCVIQIGIPRESS